MAEHLMQKKCTVREKQQLNYSPKANTELDILLFWKSVIFVTVRDILDLQAMHDKNMT